MTLLVEKGCFGQEFEPVFLFIFEYTLISTFNLVRLEVGAFSFFAFMLVLIENTLLLELGMNHVHEFELGDTIRMWDDLIK